MGLENELMTTMEAAELWGITTRRVQILCEKGKVNGAIQMGRTWIIPKGTPKPLDGRTKVAKQQCSEGYNMSDSESKNKKKRTDVTDGVSLAANTEMLGRHSEAGSQFKIAYDGVDNATGQQLKKGLKGISESKVNPDFKDTNIKQQAGFSAEVKTVARENAENIIAGKDTRSTRTDDMRTQSDGKGNTIGGTNEELYDVAEIGKDGTYIEGTARQLKFVGGNPQQCADKLLSSKFDKYRNADVSIEVPSDFYDEVKKELAEKADNLKKQIEHAEQKGNVELAAKHKTQLDKIEKTSNNLKKGKVSNKEALEARLNPELSTAKDIGRVSHRAGFEAAKVGAAVGGGISIITNTIAVLKGEKEVNEAIGDTVIDTTRAGATSYATGFTNTALASVMKNSSNNLVRSLGKANAPAYIIQTAITTTKSLASLCKGEITVNDFFLEIGKNGTTLLASAQGAVIGQLLIPIPVVGALIGGLVSSLICGAIYDCTIGMKMLNAEIDEFSCQLANEIMLLKEYQARLMQIDIDRFKRETTNLNTVADYIEREYDDQDFNLMLKLTYEYIGIPCPWGKGTLDDFMQDKKGVLTFG